MKLRHGKWLFENYILVARNVLATRIGMYDGDDESAAYQVVLATTLFVDQWFPAALPAAPDVETCVIVNNHLPSRITLQRGRREQA